MPRKIALLHNMECNDSTRAIYLCRPVQKGDIIVLEGWPFHYRVDYIVEASEDIMSALHWTAHSVRNHKIVSITK